MKKLGKLKIDPSKLLKDNELVSLKGGYGDCNGVCECWCICVDPFCSYAPFAPHDYVGRVTFSDPENPHHLCNDKYGPEGTVSQHGSVIASMCE